ncbi:MAG: hypothetical protein IJY26_02545 [Clostridia bacterium]|nr:hypothetical protein [Clostridia bacterium]
MKNKISKKGILFIANIIAFLILFLVFWAEWIIFSKGPHLTIFPLLVYQCLFTFMSLIVYYLSIIADVLSGKYKEKTTQMEERARQRKEE